MLESFYTKKKSQIEENYRKNFLALYFTFLMPSVEFFKGLKKKEKKFRLKSFLKIELMDEMRPLKKMIMIYRAKGKKLKDHIFSGQNYLRCINNFNK